MREESVESRRVHSGKSGGNILKVIVQVIISINELESAFILHRGGNRLNGNNSVMVGCSNLLKEMKPFSDGMKLMKKSRSVKWV